MSFLARRALFATASQCRRRMTTQASKQKKTLEERQVEALERQAKSLEYIKYCGAWHVIFMSFCVPTYLFRYNP